MEEAIRTLLLGTAALTARVSQRIDWGVRSQGSTLPALTLFLVSGVPQMTFSGPSGWSRDRIQIDAWGRTFLAARDLADILADPEGGLLVGLRRDLPGLRLRTFVIGRRSDTDTDASGPVHRTSLDVMAWHTPLPTE